MNVIVHRDPQHLAESAAGRVVDVVGDMTRTRVTLGLAGGSTPAETYRLLRGLAVGWERVDAWLSDERWVPQEHIDCNGSMIAELLMDHVSATFHRPRWRELLTAADSAAHYEATLRSIHPDGRADLVLLGMGDDGHTASLFPGADASDLDSGRWYVANYVPQLGVERLTATYSFLHHSKEVIFMACGADKAPALRAVLEPSEGAQPLPAARIMDGDAEVTWLVDKAAAAELTTTERISAD